MQITCEQGTTGLICFHILVFVYKDTGKNDGAIALPALLCALTMCHHGSIFRMDWLNMMCRSCIPAQQSR